MDDPDENLLRETPGEWFTKHLISAGNIFYGLVDPGAPKKEKGKFYVLKLTALVTAHASMLVQCRDTLLREDMGRENALRIVSNFWGAVKEAWSQEWNDTEPKKTDRKFFFWSSPPVWALAKVGGKLIERLHPRLKKEDFLACLNLAKEAQPDLWRRSPTKSASSKWESASGNKGADIIANDIEAWIRKSKPEELQL